MLEKFKKFMAGRYGLDQLSNGLNVLFFIMVLIGLFSKNTLVLYLSLIPLFYNYFRIFSKNFSKRYNENRIYTNMMSPLYNLMDKLKDKFNRMKLSLQKKKKRDKTKYKYYHCKNCGQELRIPRGKGKVIITCPICKHSFEGRS